ncbi:unnamed protein product [Phytomonas sp. Hart1]|nr:unnamed protein product [Phytomonas sp. Hart1]|eukprot:CCW70528.1 unnamed protein product [Phytomonas sp. isolate Hart1]
MNGFRHKHLIIGDSDEDSDDVKGIGCRELPSGGYGDAFDPRGTIQAKGLVTPLVCLDAQNNDQGLNTDEHLKIVENSDAAFLNTTSYVSNPSLIPSRVNHDVLNGAACGKAGETTDALTSVRPTTDDYFSLVTSKNVYANPVPQDAVSKISTKADSPRGFLGANNTESGVQSKSKQKAKFRRKIHKGIKQHDKDVFFGSHNHKESTSSSLISIDAPPPPARLPERAQKAALKYSRLSDPFAESIMIPPNVPPRKKSQSIVFLTGSCHSKTPSDGLHVENKSDMSPVSVSFQPSAPAEIGNLTADAIAKRGEIFISQRRPAIPSHSELKTESSHYDIDNEGNVTFIVPASVRRVLNADGCMVWAILPSHRENDSFSICEVGSPPNRLSRRAESYISSKCGVKACAQDNIIKDNELEVDVEMGMRVEEIHKNSFTSAPLQRQDFTLPSTSHFSNASLQKNIENILATNKNWTVYPYNNQALCKSSWKALMTGDAYRRTERLVRLLQPIQTGPLSDKENECKCIVYVNKNEAKLSELLCSPNSLKESFEKYLNMQPMQIDNPKLGKVAEVLSDFSHSLQLHSLLSKPVGGARINTLDNTPKFVGDLSCTVEPLCEDGPSDRVAQTLPQRIMRLCGGLVFGIPLKDKDVRAHDVRCYELFLFLPDSSTFTAYNSSPGCSTLGQLTSPPISSFPLTPRIISDPMELKACGEKLRLSGGFGQDDKVSFDDFSENISKGMQCLTLTLATLNIRKKHTIDLTLVIFPYRACSKTDDGKVLAELPPFSSDTVLKGSRMRAISLSFLTKSAFMNAYMSLLWATECNIIHPTCHSGGDSNSNVKNSLLSLRVKATLSPLMPWSALYGKADSFAEFSSIYRAHCTKFAAIALTASMGNAQSAAISVRNAFKFEDFVIKKYTSGDDLLSKKKINGDKQRAATQIKSSNIVYSSISLQQHCRTFMDSECFDQIKGDEGDAIVGYTPFGIVYRVLSQKTQEMFDIQVIPRRHVFLRLTLEDMQHANAIGKAVEVNLQQDTDAILLLKYISCLPFQPRVYDIYSDNRYYYILQEPWLSILALDQSIKGVEHRKIVKCNPLLRQVHDSTLVISLKDFIHATLNPLHNGSSKTWDTIEARLQIIRLLIAQLLLLIASLHGKGVLLGPCSTHRVLVQINPPAFESTAPEDSRPDDNSMLGTSSSRRKSITSKSLSLFVPGIGLHTSAWTYERQQCGALEYVPPMHIIEALISGDTGMEGCAWTMQDDWWSLLSISFELLATDGSTLVCPETKGAESLPTARASLNSKFVSANHILDVWKGVLTHPEISVNTTSEAVNAGIRNYVQCRVLESVAPGLDSWLASKVGEAKHDNSRGIGLKQTNNDGSTMLSPEGFKDRLNVSDVNLTPKDNKFEEASLCLPKTDSQSVISWIIFYRDWFDKVMDVALPYFMNPKCAVHAPLLYLLSHPFLGGMDMGAVFNGNYRLLPAAEEFIHKYMGKAKLRQALFLYRTHSYRPLITNQQNGLHIRPRPNDGMGIKGIQGPQRPPIIHRSMEKRVRTPDVVEPLLQFELLSHRVQVLHRVQGGLFQSLYTPDEIASINWLEREVDSALHPHADEGSAHGSP